MAKVVRGVLAVPAGFIAVFVVILAGEMAGHALFPAPAGLDESSPGAIKAAIDSGQISTAMLGSVVLAWAAGAFAGSWVAARVAPGAKLAFGMGIGVLVLAAALAHLLMIPHPLWVWVLGAGGILPVAYLGARLASPRPGADTPEALAVSGADRE
jgi:hypothetical protein